MQACHPAVFGRPGQFPERNDGMLPHHAGLVFQAVTHSLSRRAIYGVHSVYQGSAHSALALDLDSNSVSFASHLEQCLADTPASNQNRVFFRDGAIHTEQTKFARLSVALWRASKGGAAKA